MLYTCKSKVDEEAMRCFTPGTTATSLSLSFSTLFLRTPFNYIDK